MNNKTESDEAEEGPRVLLLFLYGGLLVFGLVGAPLLVVFFWG
jgi:hypothetical protein